MDIRVLRYFLAVAEEGTMSKAAKEIHVTQPNLSRQISDLEREVGAELFVRGSRQTTLTEEGLFLQKRAKEMVRIADETLATLSTYDGVMAGSVRLGGYSPHSVRTVAKVVGKMHRQHPHVHFSFKSLQSSDATAALDEGRIDFSVVTEPVDLTEYERMQLPVASVWGILARRDSQLALLEQVRPADLHDAPLLCPEQILEKHWLHGWFGADDGKLDVVMTYDLPAAMVAPVEEGVGYALCTEDAVKIPESSNLCFRALGPRLESKTFIAWKRYRDFPAPSARFLELIRQELLQVL
ncbi:MULTISPECIES: LysR family transcriptional regulator [Gordonibacter]|uniref:LysR family transcriptional regulator n=1 Tax=Gordonibacter faecis TaxID=3047475 RepID=A0ABT7DK54_9ACTN|nr:MULTISPECIES: LysR family transcriptional regulator [unclassified Gordonibacter]MDJ1649898.1 LysR family transcriptional regulator [Gordonibacter sp. KGMB12511]